MSECVFAAGAREGTNCAQCASCRSTSNQTLSIHRSAERYPAAPYRPRHLSHQSLSDQFHLQDLSLTFIRARTRLEHHLNRARQLHPLERNPASAAIKIPVAVLVNQVARVIRQGGNSLRQADPHGGLFGRPNTHGIEYGSKMHGHPFAALQIVGVVDGRACGRG